MKPVKVTVPKTIGAAIDALWGLRQERAKFAALAEATKDKELAMEARIFEMFGKSELEGAKGKLSQASVKRSDVPTINDWSKFQAHLMKTKQLDLMQKRLSVEACRARWDQGKAIPGVEVFTRISLALSRRKK